MTTQTLNSNESEEREHEQLITEFSLSDLENIHFISGLIREFYKKTDYRLSIKFTGKHELSYIYFDCENSTIGDNRIRIDEWKGTLNKDKSLKSQVIVKIYHSLKNGLRVSHNAIEIPFEG